MRERVKIHNRRLKRHYNYWEEAKRIKEAIKYFREEGITESQIEDFKKMVQDL